MIRYLLYFLFCFHLGMLLVYNVGKLIYDKPILNTEKYISPFFVQEWEMFAPPPQHNTNLYYKYAVHRAESVDTTQFYEVLGALYGNQIENDISFSRLSYYLYNCCENVTEKQIDGMISLSQDKKLNYENIDDLLKDKVYKSYSHQSIVKHAKKIFYSKFKHVKPDSVYVSYAITHDRINKKDTSETDWKITSKFVKI